VGVGKLRNCFYSKYLTAFVAAVALAHGQALLHPADVGLDRFLDATFPGWNSLRAQHPLGAHALTSLALLLLGEGAIFLELVASCGLVIHFGLGLLWALGN